MYLTLEVVSENGGALGANRRKVIGPEGAQIGRSNDNDWVLDDRLVSRAQARIRYVNGAFYVEGLGRNPVAINDPNSAIPNNEPQILRAGDRIFIEPFEVAASFSQARTDTPIPEFEDPFAEPGAVIPTSGPAEPWDVATIGGEDASDVDPLAALGGSKPPEPKVPQVNWQQGSVLDNNIELPSMRAEPPRGGGAIPDGWDNSRIEAIPKPQPQRGAPPKPVPARPVVPSRPARAPIAPAVARSPAPPPAPRPAAPRIEATGSHRSAVAAAPAAPAYMPQVSATGAFDVAELLRGAGLSNAQMSPETARELGEVLRIVVEGVMEVLHARAEIKSQFRIPGTRVQSSENNPLKFSPNVEAALHTLLVERNRGYLPTARAFQDAFADICNHQLALLEGIRAAFNAMLARFDPEKLQEEFEKQAKRGGLLGKGGKARFWELYTEHFGKVTSDADESFRTLFGDEFAEAYERQLEKLKMQARRTRG